MKLKSYLETWGLSSLNINVGLLETEWLGDPINRRQFRDELAAFQAVLRNYSRALADIAQVEDVTSLAPGPPAGLG